MASEPSAQDARFPNKISFYKFRKEGLAYTKAVRQKDESKSEQDGGEQWQEVVADGGSFVVRSTDSGALKDRWNQDQWRQAFQQLFIADLMPGLVHRENADDMLFFIRHDAAQDPTQGKGPMFVRRKGRTQLPPDCAPGGAEGDAVDWRRSTLLNTVLQTPFYLSVSTCDKQDLHEVLQFHGLAGDGGNAAGVQRTASDPQPVPGSHSSSSSRSAPGDSSSRATIGGDISGPSGGSSTLTQVTKHVFASPTRVQVNLDSSRASHASAPVVTYPDLCFAVDNFDETFDSMLLTERDRCYSVCLWAQRLTDAATSPSTASGGSSVDGARPDTASSGVSSSSACSRVTDATDGEEETEAAAMSEGVMPTAAETGGGGAVAGGDVDALADELAATAMIAGSSGVGPPTRPAGGPSVVERTSADAHPLMAAAATDNNTGAGSPAGGPGGGTGAGIGVPGGSGKQDGDLQQQQGSPCSSGGGGGGSTGPTKSGSGGEYLLMFSGYVSFQQLESVVDTTGVHPLQLWGKPGNTTTRVIMRGPGGVGHADVAVTVCSSRDGAAGAAGKGGAGGPPAAADGGSPPGAVQLRKGMFSQAVKLAGAAAKAARDMASSGGAERGPGHDQSGGSGGGGIQEPLPVRCALMSLVLPVDEVARRVLKGS